MAYEHAEKNDPLTPGDLCTFDELRLSAADQKSIADTVLAISRCKDEDEICFILGEIAHKYNPGSIVAISLYDPEINAIRFRYYFGVDGPLEHVFNLMGRDPRQVHYSPTAMTDTDRARSSSGRLVLVTDGIYELAMRKFPRAACVAAEKLLGIEHVYNIGFSLDGMPYGGLIFLMRQGRAVCGQYLLETLVRHAADVIKHRHAESKLRESQRFQSTLISNLPGMVYRCRNDREWTMEYVSDGCLKLTGYRPEELAPGGLVTYEELIRQEDRGYVRKEIESALGRGEPFEITYRIVTATGQERWVREQGQKISSAANVMLEGFITDITDRMHADEELRRSRASLSRAEEIAHVGHWEWDVAEETLHWSDESYRIFGFEPGEVGLDSRLFTGMIHPDDRDHVIETMRAPLHQDTPFDVDFRIVRRDGTVRYVHAECERALDRMGRPAKLFGIQQDVTELKRAERALRESEASLSRAEQMAHLGNWTYDLKAMVIRLSPEACRIYHLDRASEVPHAHILERIHPDDRASADRSFSEAVRDHRPADLTFRLLLPDGTERHVHCEAETRYDPDGDPLEMFGITLDITDLKRAEAELLKLSRVVEQSPNSVVITAMDGTIVYANPATSAKTGYAASDLIGKQGSFIWGDTGKPEEIREVFGRIYAGESWHGEHEFACKDGSKGWSSLLLLPIKDDAGRSIAIAAVVSDITERKRAENALLEKQRKLEESEASRSRAEQMAHLGNWTYNLKNDVMRASAEACRIYQVDPADGFSIGRFMDRTHPDDREVLGNAIQGAIRTGKPASFNFRLLLPDGTERYAHCEAQTRYDAAGEAVEVFGFTQDVTELKRAAEELHKLSRIVEQSPSSMAITTVDGIITYANSAMARRTGYAPGELIGKHGTVMWGDTGRSGETERIYAKINAGEPWHGDHEFVRKDGSKGWSSHLLSPIKDETGRTIAVAATMTDITERKLAEARIKASLAEKEVMLKEIHHRVKNNLQVISSLLSLQAAGVEDRIARQMLLESQHRIRSIALVHEKIYGSDDLAIIDFAEYTRHLTAYLQHSYCVTADRVRLTVEGEPVRLGATVAVPLGLILNELVSNCYKHAFPDGRAGKIIVSLSSDPYRLIVEDDGVGLPAGLDFRETESMGLQLVTMLAGQIEAEVTIDTSNGTKFTITFRRDR